MTLNKTAVKPSPKPATASPKPAPVVKPAVKTETPEERYATEMLAAYYR